VNSKVSVIIASYNRFEHLLKAIESVKNQTYENIELIIVNDASSDERYYSLMEDGFKLIHLNQNSKELFGYPCAGYVRRIGIEQATGDYIAILDDDDYFFNDKIRLQVLLMMDGNIQMCSSESLTGGGIYSSKKKYMIHHEGFNTLFCESFFKKYGHLYNGKLPGLFDFDLISKHNFILHSSIVFNRSLYDLSGGYKCVPNGEEDHQLWLEMLKHTSCTHLNVPLLYYDARVPNPTIYDIFRHIKLRIFDLLKNFIFSKKLKAS
jgi:glycosyltransferase involved in cell wall biosynthesis